MQNNNNNNLLPEGYIPNEYDVYCGRGSECFNHEGNRRFRQLISTYIDRYLMAVSKYDKSAIIDEIVAIVRYQSGRGGGFVKKDATTGRFYEVGDYLAREKTSQAFRDAIQVKSKQTNNIHNSTNETEGFYKMKHQANMYKCTPSSCPTLRTQTPIRPMLASTSDYCLQRDNIHVKLSCMSPNAISIPTNAVSTSEYYSSIATNHKINTSKGTSFIQENQSCSSTSSPSKYSMTSHNHELGSIFDIISSQKIEPNMTNYENQSTATNISISKELFNVNIESIADSVLSSSQDFSDKTMAIMSKLTTTLEYANINTSLHDVSGIDSLSWTLTDINANNSISTDTIHKDVPLTDYMNTSSSNLSKQTMLPAGIENFSKKNDITNEDQNNDDEKIFDALLQLTEAYPDLESCPFLHNLDHR